MEWEYDRSLRARMAVTLVLVAVTPLAFTVSMALAFNRIIVPAVEVILGFPVGTVSLGRDVFLAVFALTLVGMALAFLFGRRGVLRSTGAGQLPKSIEEELEARARRMAKTAGIPTPDIAGIDTPAPNAYATGGGRGNATIVVTFGLVRKLDADELDAVLAHEIAHIRNRDAAVMSVVYLMPAFTYGVWSITYRLMHGVFSAMSRIRLWRLRRGRGIVGLLVLVVLFMFTSLVTITVSAVFWLVSSALFMLLSQYREYAADRGATALTGDPLALASALETIEGEMQSLPDQDLRDLDGGAEALYISPLGGEMFDDEDDGLAAKLASQRLFPDSHPPTDERVERLRDLAGDLES